jgi:2-C-methyl-D-erythritol 2,4-cyclodiphosphate synthase
MAIGLGRDIHRLVPGRRLVLGGVEIPHARGLLGHSDGDVVLHAVIDALLGAAGLGDIGTKFPDTDPAYKDVSSEVLLARVMEEIRPRWSVVNADVTVVAEAPRLAPHAGEIAARVGRALGTDRVSIKAKTNEGLGPVGAGEAIECLAVVELAPRGSS